MERAVILPQKEAVGARIATRRRHNTGPPAFTPTPAWEQTTMFSGPFTPLRSVGEFHPPYR